MKTLFLLLSLLAMSFITKAQLITPIIDSILIDVSVGNSDTIITYFPTQQLGREYSILLDPTDLVSEFSWGIVVSSIKGNWSFLPNTISFPVTPPDNIRLVGGFGDNLPFPFVGIWVDRKTNTTGTIIAKRIMVWEVKYYLPF